MKQTLRSCMFAAMTALWASQCLSQVGQSTTVLNPNQASNEDLASIPQLDAELRDALQKARPFLSMSQFRNFLSEHLDESQQREVFKKLFLPIDLNRADPAEFLLVPGVGKRIAHEFEEYRPYENLKRFRREIGKYVDKEEVARLEQYVFVPIDLNTASDEDILTIPGLGKRLLHEFKEYRPYRSMAQFRREIGKYVSDKELARLERYVLIKGDESQ